MKRIDEDKEDSEIADNHDYVDAYLTAKQIEGCSIRTISYYKLTLKNMFRIIDLPIRRISTEIIRESMVLVSVRVIDIFDLTRFTE